MTTAPVVTVTDELIEMLSALTCLDQGGAVLIHADQVRSLLAERAELKRDAERYRWLRDGDSSYFLSWHACSFPFKELDASIDAAMQEQGK